MSMFYLLILTLVLFNYYYILVTYYVVYNEIYNIVVNSYIKLFNLLLVFS